MADSENSRTLPAITCRNPLQTAEWFLSQNFSEQERWAPGIRDVALVKWNAWRLASRELVRLGREQQELENRLMSLAPVPQVEVRQSGTITPFVASSAREIQERLKGDAFASARASAEAELLARRRRWEAMDETVGYSRAKDAEFEASLIEESLAAELSQAPAMTTVAVAAKLHCILERGPPRADSDEFPWPQVRSLLIDILAMNGVFSMEASRPAS
jgi:hypothetical protein